MTPPENMTGKTYHQMKQLMLHLNNPRRLSKRKHLLRGTREVKTVEMILKPRPNPRLMVFLKHRETRGSRRGERRKEKSLG